MDIGRRLKIAREAIGYTLKHASEFTGIGESSISEFENSKREPKFSQLSQFAKAYKKTVEFFLSDEPIFEGVMLWRDKPETEAAMKKTEAEFNQLCKQYRNLEILMDEIKEVNLPEADIKNPDQFDYKQAELFANKVKESFRLGSIPIVSLKRILEERFYVKIFYLDFTGSAISMFSEKFGPVILLNEKNKQWRRSFDLAHELFHILTWKVFRPQNPDNFIANKKEEKLAGAFASRLLMPEESIKDKVEINMDADKRINLERLDDIAREFNVSLEALIYRIAGIYKFKKEETAKYIAAAEKYLKLLKPRPSYKPNKFPERYCDLAQRALIEGKMSLMQFAKYMDISYREAQAYLTEDEDFKDEKISISVA